MPKFDYYPKSNPPVDPYIKSIQEKLNYIRISHKTLNKGYDGKAYNWPHLSVDGQYGQQTSDVVKAFQVRRGIIPASGILGPTTARFIEEAYNKGGISSNYVLDIQRKLNYVCKLNIAEDGLWGQETSKALQIFRDTYGAGNRPLQPNGELDAYTLIKLDELYRRGSLLKQTYNSFESVAKSFISPLADTLRDISNSACDEIRRLEGQQITPARIREIMRSMFNKPKVNQLRCNIEKYIWADIEKKAHGNTNAINYSKGPKALQQAREIGEAQRQMKTKILSPQSRAAVNKALNDQIKNKCLKELESIRFDKLITEKLGKVGTKIPKGGGGLLTALAFLPFGMHIAEYVYCVYNGKDVTDAVKRIVEDLISMITGVIIGAIIGIIVALCGITGGMAILIVLGAGIVVGLLLSFFFPDWEKEWADKIVEWIYKNVNSTNIQNLINNSGLLGAPAY